jgi:hypothetical protein
MDVWPVFLQDWQIECCGSPFSVGDEVAWTLGLYDSVEPLPDEYFVTLEVDPANVAQAGGLTAAWDGRGGRQGDNKFEGC